MSTETLVQDREKLLNIIKEDGYFQGKITLSSGKESDYYIDARRVTLKPEGAALTAKLMLDVVKDINYDAIGGPTLGADPLIGAIGVLSFQNGNPKNTFIIRKAAKAHGKQQQVEGPEIKEGAEVILIDDVATTGKAFIESIDVLNQMGIRAVKCLCVVDRREGASEAVQAKGSELVSLFDITEIHTP